MRKLALSLLILTMLTGCWSSLELNDQAFVSLLIIDRNDDGIEVTYGVPLTTNLTSGDAGGSAPGSQVFGFFSRTAPTLEEAIQKVQGDLSRRANIGQNRNIVIGRRFAESGITPVLELAARNPYIRMNTNMFLIDGYAKEEVSKATVVSERFFVSILNNYIEQRTVLQTTIKDFMLSKASGGDGLLPIINFSNASEGAIVGKSSTVSTGGAGIIKKGKLVEPILTPDQTSAAQSIRNQLGQYYFSIKVPKDEGWIGLYSSSVDVQTKIMKLQNKYHIILTPTSEVEAIGNNSDMNFTIYENVKKLEDSIEQYSNELLVNSMEVIQQTGADVFHFDRYMMMKYPKEWDKVKDHWREYYRDQLVIDIDSVFHIRRKGSTVRSFKSQFIDNNEGD